MEGEGQPLILHTCGEKTDEGIRLLSDDTEELKRQGKMESTREKPLCRNVASCGLVEKSPDDKKMIVSRRLWLAAAFCLALMVVEVVGGFIANSLAILADAAHLLSDVASFGVSIFAVWASGWKPTTRCSFGFHRLETLGALLSILIIWIVTGCLVYEAVHRLVHELSPVNGRLMFAIAAIGFSANLVMVFILGHQSHGHDHHHDHCKHSSSFGDEKADISATKLEIEVVEKQAGAVHKNLNLRGAYLHILGDMIQSVGVLLGGAIIWRYPRLRFIDVICTLVFSLVVLWTTLRLLRDVVEILMETSPREIEIGVVQSALEHVHPDVLGVHELHIWSATIGKVLLSCHVTVKRDADADTVLREVIGYCDRELKITHVTIQVERDDVDQV